MNKLKNLFDRVKENYSKNKIVVTILLLLWVVTVVATLFTYKDTLGKGSTGNEAFDNVVELIQGTTIEEVLPAEEGADAIAIKVATYARNNSGTFNVKVTGNNTKKVYADKTINVQSVQDNAFTVIALDENLVGNETIKVVLSSDSVKDKAIGVYYSDLKVFENSILKVGNRLMQGDLSMRFMKDNEDLHLFYMIVISFVITTFTIIILLILLVKPKYEILFTVIAICFGLTFWLIITPMSVPDETVHYEYSFQLSNKMMGNKNHLLFDEDYQDYGAMVGHYNISAAYERFIKKINRPLTLEGKMIKMNIDIDESYTSCFIPQALGITVARLLNWNMLRTFYLGRLFNLIFYIICVYIAIKKTPVHKVLFGIMATLPIFMQQAASFSYDCYINGLTFVIIAFLMKWIHEDKPIDKKDFIIAFMANLMISPIKVVYGLFSFLYWFIPKERFGSKKNKIIGTLILTGPAIYQLAILLFPIMFRVIRKIYENVFMFNATENTLSLTNMKVIRPMELEGDIYTFSYVMEHPLEMIEIFLRTVRYNIKTWFYASFGRALSGNTLILPTWLVHSILAILVFASLRNDGKPESLGFKLTTLFLCVFGGIMMVGGLLVSWTEMDQAVIEDFGGPIIQGVQGRYFSPMLPYLFILLNNKKLKLDKKFDEYLIYAFVLLVFEVIVYVLSYTFMN